MTVMTDRIPVRLVASDPILANGLRDTLRFRDEIRLVTSHDAPPETVVVLATDGLDEAARQTLRSLRCRQVSNVVLIVAEMEDADLLAAIEYGVSAVARRADVDASSLVRLVRAVASGDGALPPDMLGRLLGRVSALQRDVLAPRGLALTGLTDREIEVLRLLAAGMSTHEIARELCFSPRTIKAVVHDVVNRFQLRNRSHAVAFALRAGLI